MDTHICRDIWIRHTDTDGRSAVVCHRVWDAERFVAAQQRSAEQLNLKAEDGASHLAKVEQITEEQYKAERR